MMLEQKVDFRLFHASGKMQLAAKCNLLQNATCSQPAGLPLAGTETLIRGGTATQGGCTIQDDKIIEAGEMLWAG